MRANPMENRCLLEAWRLCGNNVCTLGASADEANARRCNAGDANAHCRRAATQRTRRAAAPHRAPASRHAFLRCSLPTCGSGCACRSRLGERAWGPQQTAHVVSAQTPGGHAGHFSCEAPCGALPRLVSVRPVWLSPLGVDDFPQVSPPFSLFWAGLDSESPGLSDGCDLRA